MSHAANLAPGNFYGDATTRRKPRRRAGTTRARVRAELRKGWFTCRELEARLGVTDAHYHIQCIKKLEIVFCRTVRFARGFHGGKSYEHVYRIFDQAINVVVVPTQVMT